MSLQQITFAAPSSMPLVLHLSAKPAPSALRRRRPWTDNKVPLAPPQLYSALLPRRRERPSGPLRATVAQSPSWREGESRDDEQRRRRDEKQEKHVESASTSADAADAARGGGKPLSNNNSNNRRRSSASDEQESQRPQPSLPRGLSRPSPGPSVNARAVDGRIGGRRSGVGSGGIFPEAEDVRAAIEELLGTQQLGSGSWKEPGQAGGSVVPAAVEREQRTLVREIKAMSRKARWKEVMEVVETARYQGTPLNVIIYRCAISAVGRCGRWQEAVALLDQMQAEDIEPDEYAYTAAIAACSNANQCDKALEIFRAMDRDARGASGGAVRNSGRDERQQQGGRAAAAGKRTPRPGTASYNATIKAYGRALQPKEALALLQEMRDRGVPRDEITYNSAIDACAKGGLWETALTLLTEMSVAGASVPAEVRFGPSLVSYNNALDACARAGRWEEAADLLSMMRYAGASGEDEDYDLFFGVEALQDENHGEKAIPPVSHTTVESAFTGAATRPPAPDTFSYNACITACRMGGEQGLARLFLMEMMSRDLRPNGKTISAMLTEPIGKWEGKESGGGQREPWEATTGQGALHGRKSRWRQALLLLDVVACEGLGPDPSCVEVVLAECAKAGRWEESRQLLKDLGNLSGPSSGADRWTSAPGKPDITMYNTVLNMLRKAPPSSAPPAHERVPPVGAENRDVWFSQSQRTRVGGGTISSDTTHSYRENENDREYLMAMAGRGGGGGAQGWRTGQVTAFLDDMRAADVRPDEETFRCTIRCATDAAVADAAQNVERPASNRKR